MFCGKHADFSWESSSRYWRLFFLWVFKILAQGNLALKTLNIVPWVPPVVHPTTLLLSSFFGIKIFATKLQIANISRIWDKFPPAVPELVTSPARGMYTSDRASCPTPHPPAATLLRVTSYDTVRGLCPRGELRIQDRIGGFCCPIMLEIDCVTAHPRMFRWEIDGYDFISVE